MAELGTGVAELEADTTLELDLSDCSGLASVAEQGTGVAELKAFTTQVLNFGDCGVGGAGFEAVAAQVPRWTRLRVLSAQDNPGPSDALGWALVAALV